MTTDRGKDFVGKVAIVTGGSKGIGEACVRALHAAGATVVTCARGTGAGVALERELRGSGAGECVFRPCDVAKPGEVEDLVGFTVERFGRLDCLVNNAGWHPPDARIDEVTVEEFRSLLDLNLVSMFAACRSALPHLRKTRGSIVNMSSLVGSMGQANACAYVATKAAIVGFTRALAIDEAANGVRVNSVSPACIVTPLAETIMNLAPDPAREELRLKRWHQLGRRGTGAEVAAACLFLASEEASFITGIDLPVSGGAELGYGDKFGGHAP